MGARDHQTGRNSAVRQDAARQTAHADLRPITSRLEDQERDDLSQDAKLKLLQLEARENVKTPLHLLRKIARNLVTDRLRQQSRTQSRNVELVVDSHACTLPDPERIVMANQRLSQAMTIIDTMPDRRREAFLLHRIEGLSYPQIARRMGVSSKAVEKHIALAMIDLTRSMQKIERNE